MVGACMAGGMLSGRDKFVKSIRNLNLHDFHKLDIS